MDAIRLPQSSQADPALGLFVDDLLADGDCRAGAVPTGLRVLDTALEGGLRKGQLTVVAGEPGVGTSTLALNFAAHASIRRGFATVVSAPDSSHHEILVRLVSAETKVPVNHLRSRGLTTTDLDKVRRKQDVLRDAPLHITAGWDEVSTASRVVTSIEAWIDTGLTLAVVDGTVASEPQVRELARGLKLLAVRSGLAVVLATKTSTPQDRFGHPPRLDDLRAYDDLADLADLVVLLHRDDVHDHSSIRPGEADLEIVKHRYGPSRTVTVAFQGHYARFVDMA